MDSLLVPHRWESGQTAYPDACLSCDERFRMHKGGLLSTLAEISPNVVALLSVPSGQSHEVSMFIEHLLFRALWVLRIQHRLVLLKLTFVCVYVCLCMRVELCMSLTVTIATLYRGLLCAKCCAKPLIDMTHKY